MKSNKIKKGDITMITININTNGKITLTPHTTPKEKQKYPLQFQTAYELKQKEKETLP